jgi:hypothetical protein
MPEITRAAGQEARLSIATINIRQAIIIYHYQF